MTRLLETIQAETMIQHTDGFGYYLGRDRTWRKQLAADVKKLLAGEFKCELPYGIIRFYCNDNRKVMETISKTKSSFEYGIELMQKSDRSVLISHRLYLETEWTKNTNPYG